VATQTLADPPPIVRKAMSLVSDIATLPEVTVKIINIVEAPRSTARDLHEVIKTDPALSARLLKVVNSAFYGLPGQVATIDRAIVLLGLSTVKNIAIAASISRLFTGERISETFTGKDIWRHSVAVAVLTRQIYKQAFGHQPDADEAFLCGLIHDLGLLVIRQAFPEQLAQVIDECAKNGGNFCEIEERILGANHQIFGQQLAAKWKFPTRLRTVLGYHHAIDALSPEHRAMPTIIHVADTIAAQESIGFPLTAACQTLTPEVLESIDLTPDAAEELRATLAENLASAEATLTG
jgi:HD-like signal output (HDOD) protein